MNKVIKIKVTKEDTAKGIRAACNRCPIARAVARHYKHEVSVDSHGIRIYRKGKHVVTYLNPAVAWMNAFDSGRTVKPFTLVLKRD